MTSYTTGDAGGLIGLAQIARMANVSSSLVIHWRKTRSDFPDPAGRGARGELYEPGAVLDWLDRNGRLDRGTAAVAQVWAVADTLRDRVGPSDYLLIVLSALADQDPPPAIADQLTGAEWVAVSTGIRDVVNEADRSAVATTVMDTVARGQGRAVDHYTPPTLREVIAGLAGPIAGTVLDPAAGSGSLLIAAAEQATAPIEILGADLNADAVTVARLRTAIAGLTGEVVVADSLGDDPFAGVEADIVLINPPWGVKRSADKSHDLSPTLGTQPGSVTDLSSGALGDSAWLFYAANHLRPGGRAVVVTPRGLLWGAARQKWIPELLRRGAIDAIVTLPGGLAAQTNIQSVAWVLRGPTRDTRGQDVLLIDADIPDFEWDQDPQAAVESIHTLIAKQRTPGTLPVECAVPVPVLDLLDPQASLTPAHWIAVNTAPDQDAAKRAFSVAESGFHDALSTLAPLADTQTNATDQIQGPPPATVTLGDLERRGVIQIRKGVNIKRDAIGDEGVPVITPDGVHDLRADHVGKTWEFPRNAEPTAPGTVVFLPLGPNVRAGVDWIGGAALTGSMVGIVQDANTPFIPPLLLAALLSGTRVAAMATGSTLQRVNVRDVAIPVLTDTATHGLLQAVSHAAHAKAAGADVARTAQNVIGALVDAAWAGVAPAPDSTRPELVWP